MWTFNQISTSTVSIVGALAGFTVSNKEPRVYYIGSSNHVYELAYQNGKWGSSDLMSQASGAPAANASSALAGCINSDGEPRVFYTDALNHVYELVYQNGRWNYSDLTNRAVGAASTTTGSRLVAFTVSNGELRVYYIASSHVWELAYQNGKWSSNDVTKSAKAPDSTADSALAGFSLSNGEPRVYYISASEPSIQELIYQNGKWSYSNLMKKTKTPSTVQGSPLAGFTVSSGEPRVCYIDTSNHVDELAYQNGKWGSSDLTKRAGAVPAVQGSKLAGFTVSNGEPRVYYAGPNGSDNDVYELVYQNGKWRSSNIALEAGANHMAAKSALMGFSVSNEEPRVYYVGIKDNANYVYELAWQA
ncbi:MAG TPA: hypothetical protein VKY19_23925 [Ktedonosporobacter sp.]|jgi:hypothetical protein|nr:hypothetical protein [Ktedonosporobacter sp.]